MTFINRLVSLITSVLSSIIISFSTYSIIPMPRVEWDEKNRKYSLIFFPLIGVVIGGVLCGWWGLSGVLGFGVFMRSAVALAIPVFITGGIHLDGFIDTVDALGSYQPKERKLEILKDPHTGAFALISCSVYFILYFGALTEMKSLKAYIMLSLGFILSRALSGLGLVLFRSAKKQGLLYAFSSAAHRGITGFLLGLILFICLGFLLYVDRIGGSVLFLMALLIFWYYKRVSYSQFGGITGDLAGFFLQVCELAIVIAVAVIL
ncbi:adenosylcobinamide-GDP ribazoletransferase [Anaerocolumna sp. MB42-C2]|uniref:adenosylcobinamide-GDP ribazoletransferase n=1 Tax=Anaerocolumna sp. MB42-C2 TaxID=3070997 RepID=UPI0027DEF5D5|nr:adenosylcobinamide-GDP ribazoletransferase [Anaerocolumna sp. MB42-C2]WMJ89526.1 adenosylcobinamide-GDP ribazoletransferase [Anaerocolumna sp. MB42-C2]